MLEQVSQPFNAMVTGFILAFETVADAHDHTDPETPTEELLQGLALTLALDDTELALRIAPVSRAPRAGAHVDPMVIRRTTLSEWIVTAEGPFARVDRGIAGRPTVVSGRAEVPGYGNGCTS
ncbi:hypothetical protein [Streptomyces sp. NPDC058623]|uniref:hypothetical protein n=1 Tax=Streptomyces sp. NPDC058623 TaxID=3346563 RepID=UPI003656C455